jgi:anti-sigma-K factor RskA
MKKPLENHDATPPEWMRWLDGEMPAAERAAFEQTLATDPALQAEVTSARHLSDMLKQALPAEMEIPHGDFFNSQIQVRLAQLDQQERRTAPAAKVGWLDWLRSPWLIRAAATAVIAVLLLRPDGSGVNSPSDTLVMSTYAPNPKVVVNAFHSDEAEATVLMLEGLEDLPADRKVVGWNLDSGRSDPASASMAFSGPSGQVEVVMMRDAQNQPRLWVPRS